MKPDNLVPGLDVGMKALANDEGLAVMIVPTHTRVIVRYDEGSDLYVVTVKREGEAEQTHENVFCDDLGPLVWGEDAKPWTQPFGQLIDPASGDVISEW